ncbi:BON domain-containing protein [Cupriavidus sp. 2TAF22]|uniref:BON domain-containing protein n=1 Tax=unclassified Cupriavidus TaxID=2640874 RepID=UPI003F8F36D1
MKSDAKLRQDGREELEWVPQICAAGIAAQVSDDASKVMLSGTLRNWAEIRAARETAWSAPRVTQLVARMMVGP